MPILIGFLVVAGLLVLAAVLLVASALNLWIQARASGVRVTVPGILMMRLRRLSPRDVADSMITMGKAGIEVSSEDVQAHVLAGGNLVAVTEALIRAEKADLDMTFEKVAAIDLAGRNVLDAVQTHVNPKVLACPPSSRENRYISGVCGDGIRLSATARVTVRTRLDRLVGGAGEGTIVARVGEGIVAAIGNSESHKMILENPELISRYILSRGLDSNTCYEILSVDIADVNVEENIGARLRSEQAETDKRVAQARAEMRRAAAVAVHTEMRARTTEMESRLVAARAVVPRGVAATLREANFGHRASLAPNQNSRMLWRPAV